MKKETNQSSSEESQGLCCCTALHLPFETLVFHMLSQHNTMFVKPNILHKPHFLSLYSPIIWQRHALQKQIFTTAPFAPSKDVKRALLDLKRVRNPIQTQIMLPRCPQHRARLTCIPNSEASAQSASEIWAEAISPSPFAAPAQQSCRRYQQRNQGGDENEGHQAGMNAPGQGKRAGGAKSMRRRGNISGTAIAQQETQKSERGASSLAHGSYSLSYTHNPLSCVTICSGNKNILTSSPSCLLIYFIFLSNHLFTKT